MGTQQRAADGTLRAREPYQDEAGNWCCGACGRAHGFKSKHAVLGHLRACRPGKPAIDALMADAGKPPAATGRALYIPTQAEVTAVGMEISGAAELRAMMSKIDSVIAGQQRTAVALGNHITHLSAQNGTSASAKAAAPSAFSWGKFAAVAGGAVAAAVLLRERDEPKQVVKRDPRLDRLCKRFAEKGEELPDECREPSTPLAGVSPSQKGAKAGAGSTLGRLAENGAKTLFENLFANVGKQAAKQIAG